jgi:hypothetical protein
MDGQRHCGIAADVLPLWMTSAEACARLGVRPRALRLACQRGGVERTKVGRESRYRIVTAAPTAAVIAAPEATAAVTAASIAASPALPQWTAADIERLVSELGEAVAVGWMLADERDRLRAQVRTLTEGLVDLAVSPGSVFVRQRIRRLLLQAYQVHGPGRETPS